MHPLLASVSGNQVVDAIIGFAALIIAIGVLRQKVFTPLAKLDRTLPVMVSIADEFRADSGNSLRDVIDTMQTMGASLQTYTHDFKHDLVEKLAVVSGNQDLIFEQIEILKAEAQANQDHSSEQIDSLRAEAEERQEDIFAQIASLRTEAEMRQQEIFAQIDILRAEADRRDKNDEPSP